MRDRFGKRNYALRNGAESAGFHAPEIADIGALKSKKAKSFGTAVNGRNGLAVCEQKSPKSSELEQRYRAFHASLNTTNRQRSI